jgi:hypothetical protein
MNYQSVRAVFESPLQTDYGALSPAIPVYFDNLSNALSDSVDEFVHVNLQFGLTTESALTAMHDQIRGTIVIRVYTEKGQGPARNQTLVNTAISALKTINNTAKTTSGVFTTIGSIEGPSFGSAGGNESREALLPYFMSRIETSFQATFIS